MAEAPTEAIAEILSWLPVKTLQRFKSVSKAWNNLISDSWFFDLHRRRSRRNLNFLYVKNKEEEEGNFGLTFNCVDSEWNISKVFAKTLQRKSCNGGFHCIECLSSYNDLMCIITSRWQSCEHIYLYHPVTHQIVSLPERYSCSRRYSYAVFGFGYLSSTRQYKVLRLLCNHEIDYLDITKCEILTFSPGNNRDNTCFSWKAICDSFPCSVQSLVEPFFVHECFHWLTSIRGEFNITSFDLRTEKFSTIPLPSEIKTCPDIYLSPRLLVDDFEGNLIVFKHHSDRLLSLWVLEDYDKHIWNKSYDIDLSPIEDVPHAKLCRYMANGELLIIGSDPKREFDSHYCYNAKSQSFRRVLAPRKRRFRWSRGFYWESMVTL